MGDKRNRKYFIKCTSFNLNALNTCKKYAYIFHDNDTKTPHFHICCEFDNAKTMSSVIKYLELDSCSNVSLWNNKGALEYLIHLRQKDKYQYSSTLVKTKNLNYEIEIKENSDTPITLCDIWYLLNYGNKLNKTQLEKISKDTNLSKKINVINLTKWQPACINFLKQYKLLKVIQDTPLEIWQPVIACVNRLLIDQNDKDLLIDTLVSCTHDLFIHLQYKHIGEHKT